MERTPWLDEDVARVDAEIYLRRPPGYGLGYTVGMLQMQHLLADRKMQLGDEFNLKDFHDTFMAAGRLPVSLIRWEMTGLDDEVARTLAAQAPELDLFCALPVVGLRSPPHVVPGLRLQGGFEARVQRHPGHRGVVWQAEQMGHRVRHRGGVKPLGERRHARHRSDKVRCNAAGTQGGDTHAVVVAEMPGGRGSWRPGHASPSCNRSSRLYHGSGCRRLRRC